MHPISIQNLGIIDYREALKLQEEKCKHVISGDCPQTLILCEHPPVITHGKGADHTSLLSDSKVLKDNGLEVVKVGRGGDFTYHGPGQLIAYPIIDLRTKKRDVGWYMRGLEECVIRLLEVYGIPAFRISGRTGVFVDPKPDSSAEFAKICSLGVRLSRWCSYHGLALYLTDQSAGFQHLYPCGYTDTTTVSMEQHGASVARERLEMEFVKIFCEVFGFFVA
ncbi:MAG: lipoyl(octanoyl) transferase LipB [Bdellovibrionales bacterium]|nr:lipoyl(octanoyl) transferase LipB [Bdellovibrionales bacterium]